MFEELFTKLAISLIVGILAAIVGWRTKIHLERKEL